MLSVCLWWLLQNEAGALQRLSTPCTSAANGGDRSGAQLDECWRWGLADGRAGEARREPPRSLPVVGMADDMVDDGGERRRTGYDLVIGTSENGTVPGMAADDSLQLKPFKHLLIVEACCRRRF